MAGRIPRARTAVRIAFALLVALALHAQAIGDQNDGDSGRDAPDQIADAVRLKELGDSSGSLTSDDSGDWFKVKVSRKTAPVCVVATLTSEKTLDAHLAGIVGDSVREAQARVSPTRPAQIGVASGGFDGAFLRVSPAASGTNVPYDFSLRALTPADLGTPDAGTGHDAGSSALEAFELDGGCVSGVITPSAGDTRDTYRFAGRAGDRVLFSLADTSGMLRASLRSAAGDLLASTVSGDFGSLTLASTGDYFLSVASTSSSTPTSTYTLGYCGANCGPPEEPCEPACVDLLASDP